MSIDARVRITLDEALMGHGSCGYRYGGRLDGWNYAPCLSKEQVAIIEDIIKMPINSVVYMTVEDSILFNDAVCKAEDAYRDMVYKTKQERKARPSSKFLRGVVFIAVLFVVLVIIRGIS